MITISTLTLSFLAAAAVFFLALPLAGLVSLIGIPLVLIGGPIVLTIGGIVIGGPIVIGAILLIVYFVFGNGLGSPELLQALVGLAPNAGEWLARLSDFLPF